MVKKTKIAFYKKSLLFYVLKLLKDKECYF